jgi:hypothetical protein
MTTSDFAAAFGTAMVCSGLVIAIAVYAAVIIGALQW